MHTWSQERKVRLREESQTGRGKSDWERKVRLGEEQSDWERKVRLGEEESVNRNNSTKADTYLGTGAGKAVNKVSVGCLSYKCINK
jgi:hypothetical protein